VIRSVICDARGEAVARAVRPGLLDGMRELEERAWKRSMARSSPKVKPTMRKTPSWASCA
ncbi:MAG: hypothetical protein KHX83_08475, partial [Bilophila sp.]|uniref:hypothetical protein n=1 Tax=Bilophila sp. TaxID=1929485 RepID=UPI00257B6AAC